MLLLQKRSEDSNKSRASINAFPKSSLPGPQLLSSHVVRFLWQVHDRDIHKSVVIFPELLHGSHRKVASYGSESKAIFKSNLGGDHES
ncbi:hypothetical protein VARIO8X_120298 [Burkholderiales bacterium 8X]|nr:hypothetical protein VARIO8X_120298 [Burkholderiales bacterium 8X]